MHCDSLWRQALHVSFKQESKIPGHYVKANRSKDNERERERETERERQTETERERDR